MTLKRFFTIAIAVHGGAAAPGCSNEAPSAESSTPSNMTPSSFGWELGRVLCRAAYDCGCEGMRGIYPTVEECGEQLGAYYSHRLAVASTTQNLDADCAERMLADVHDLGCGDEPPLGADGCQVFSGKTRRGDPCWAPTDCAPDLFCSGSVADSVCEPRRGADEPCAFSSSCEDGLRCVRTTEGIYWSVCTAPRAEGDSCKESSDCEEPLACRDGSCAQPQGIGESCAGDCGPGAFCSVDRVCESARRDGQPCQSNLECVGGCGMIGAPGETRKICQSPACALLLGAL